jgi:rhamnosyltransferase
MKILICGSRGIPAQYGGFESLAQALADNFNKNEHVTVVTGFTNEIKVPVINQASGNISYQVPARGPRFVQNFLCTWKATSDLDTEHNFDAVIVLNDVNYFVARKYWRKAIRTVLHLDGAEAKRSGLPFVGKFAHWFFRRLAIKSDMPLVVDSVAIKEGMNISSQKAAVISYAPHDDEAKKPEYKNMALEPKEYFVAVARFVDENQILQLIDGFISSGRDEQLLVIGLGTGSKKYENRAIEAALSSENVHVLPKNYDRAEINWLLQNAKGYIHGHSVGGTNPILVDARLHAQLILSHDNAYNRENSGHKEHFWSNSDQLTKFLKNIDLLEVNTDASDYGLDSWETIALQYLDLLTKRD